VHARRRMEPSTALVIVAAGLPTIGTVVVGILSALMSRTVREIDKKLEQMSVKADVHGDRLTRLEARLDAQAAALTSLETRFEQAVTLTLPPPRRR